jgi:hypothetical protein
MTNSKVSLKDIYDVVNRLEDKMDKRLCDVETRVNVLEDFKGKMAGMTAIISTIFGALVSWFIKEIKN